MATPLIFQPLQHRSVLNYCICNKKRGCQCSPPENLSTPGIYIWGFLYERKKKNDPIEKCPICKSKLNWKLVKDEIDTPKQNDGYLFIPYYVGKSESNLIARLNEHITNKEFKKYIRLKECFMTCFHKHTSSLSGNKNLPTFPIMRKSKNYNSTWLSLHEYLTFYNSRYVCCAINNKLSPERDVSKDYPIDQFYQEITGNKQYENTKLSPSLDPLKYRLEVENNFWFTCAAYNNNLENAEAATFFALRGWTISRTHYIRDPQNWKIKNKSNFNIFLNRYFKTCDQNDEFNWPGYF